MDSEDQYFYCYHLISCSEEPDALKILSGRVVRVHVDHIWPMAYFDSSKNRYIWLPILCLTPTEGFPWDDLLEMFGGCQRMAKIPNATETTGYAMVVHGRPKTPKNRSFFGVTQPPGVAQPLYSRGHN